jgi:hypothetical protein
VIFVQGNTPLTEDLVVEVAVSGGIASAWVADRLSSFEWTVVELLEGNARICWKAGARGSFEVFLDPVRPGEARLVFLKVAGEEQSAQIEPPPIGGSRKPLLRATLPDGRTVTVKHSINPVPTPAMQTQEGTLDLETRRALQELGYLVP